MALPNAEAIHRWIEDAPSPGGISKSRKRGYNGNTIKTNRETGELFYLNQRARGGQVEEATLARWLPRYRTFLLNGDGMLSWLSQRLQTELRILVRRKAQEIGARVIIIPFAALDTAEVDIPSIKPIDVRDDTFDYIPHEVSVPTKFSELPEDARKLVQEQVANYQGHYLSQSANVDWEGRTLNLEFRLERYYERLDDPTAQTTSFPLSDWHMWSPPKMRPREDLFGPEHPMRVAIVLPGGRQQRISKGMHYTDRNELAAAPWAMFDPSETKFGWVEEVHHLGASVFSAVGEDNRRHRFISAFDENEHTPMYFLAQLPDTGSIKSYNDALESLKPPIVKAAEAAGRKVYRQGDIFAIATTKTAEDLLPDTRTRMARDLLLTERGAFKRDVRIALDAAIENTSFRARGVTTIEQARRALMIYGTGHTATDVIVLNNGVTYVSGMMYHDPALEETGRPREHDNLALNESQWFLVVRNTVPRRRRRRPNEQEENA
jgi:hypothetical protein